MKVYDFLEEYSKTGRIPYHMPGHKRNQNFKYIKRVCSVDFTEIEGLDNLHAPTGILAESEDYAAEVYGSKKTFYLVNGSTGGILSSVFALCRRKHLIMARNCHKSVYNAASIADCSVSYILPEVSDIGFSLDITPASVSNAIYEHPEAAAVVITSPTYEGIVSDVAGIAKVCHDHGIPLIVDSAHGAHLGFLDGMVPSPVAEGADITIMSLHKTLPSLTQTALLHVSGDLVDCESISSAIGMFETSSPSYIFMASMDGCVREIQNPEIFSKWMDRIARIRSSVCDSELEIVTPKDVFAYDNSKIILHSPNACGHEIGRILRDRFNIEPEMICPYYVLLMTGAGDTDEMTDALCKALKDFPKLQSTFTSVHSSSSEIPTVAMTPAEADSSPCEYIDLADSEGRVAAEQIAPYPPGIPLVAPGEIISRKIIDSVLDLQANNISVVSSRGEFSGNIKVVMKTY